MIKTQVQLPDALYRDAKRVAREREMSLAEVVRRGVEYITRLYPPLHGAKTAWRPPPPRHLGAFRARVEDWRLIATEPPNEGQG
jgi:hypothetical protein